MRPADPRPWYSIPCTPIGHSYGCGPKPAEGDRITHPMLRLERGMSKIFGRPVTVLLAVMLASRRRAKPSLERRSRETNSASEPRPRRPLSRRQGQQASAHGALLNALDVGQTYEGRRGRTLHWWWPPIAYRVPEPTAAGMILVTTYGRSGRRRAIFISSHPLGKV